MRDNPVSVRRSPPDGHDACRAVARSSAASAIAWFWGFAEATLFFIVPDVWIGFVALYSRGAALRAVLWAVVGAMVGGVVMYGFGARNGPARARTLLDAVPAISLEMIDRVEQEMRHHGPSCMMLGPLRGTPYKIYATAAGRQRQPIGRFLLWTVPARGVRFLLVGGLAAGWAAIAGRFTRRNGWLVGPYLVAWVIFYAAYFKTVGGDSSRRDGPPTVWAASSARPSRYAGRRVATRRASGARSGPS